LAEEGEAMNNHILNSLLGLPLNTPDDVPIAIAKRDIKAGESIQWPLFGDESQDVRRWPRAMEEGEAMSSEKTAKDWVHDSQAARLVEYRKDLDHMREVNAQLHRQVQELTVVVAEQKRQIDRMEAYEVARQEKMSEQVKEAATSSDHCAITKAGADGPALFNASWVPPPDAQYEITKEDGGEPLIRLKDDMARDFLRQFGQEDSQQEYTFEVRDEDGGAIVARFCGVRIEADEPSSLYAAPETAYGTAPSKDAATATFPTSASVTGMSVNKDCKLTLELTPDGGETVKTLTVADGSETADAGEREDMEREISFLRGAAKAALTAGGERGQPSYGDRPGDLADGVGAVELLKVAKHLHSALRGIVYRWTEECQVAVCEFDAWACDHGEEVETATVPRGDFKAKPDTWEGMKAEELSREEMQAEIVYLKEQLAGLVDELDDRELEELELEELEELECLDDEEDEPPADGMIDKELMAGILQYAQAAPRHYRLGDVNDTVVDLDWVCEAGGPWNLGENDEKWYFVFYRKGLHVERLATYPTEQAARDAYKRLTLALCGEE